ncbi:flippase [Candidatus Bipolaricaulota bacterium]
MNKLDEVRTGLLARNTLLNFIGQAVPLLVGVITVPIVVRGLGTERYGLLSLAWMVLGYFAIFDLGLGVATTKFVAEALGKDAKDQIPQIVWTAVTFQAVLGVVGALVVFGITPLLVDRILNIPSELVGEAKAVFFLLAVSVPVALVSGSFRGVLAATQRFDLVNAVKIPTSISTFLLPLVGVLVGFKLPGIVALILAARVGALTAFVAASLRLVPSLKNYAGSISFFPRLFAFGGWVTISNIVSPMLVYMDRFLIGSLISMSAVSYYSIPYQAVTTLWIIPGSLTMTLFPAFSALEAVKDRQRLSTLFARSVKFVLLILGPILLVTGLFAKEILQIWLGADFGIRSTAVLRILALGVFINSLAHTPYALLQGMGRPDLPAKFHLLELPIYIGVVWLLVSRWGISGAAAAWTMRVTVDAFLLFWATFKVNHFSPRVLRANGTALAGLALAVLVGAAYATRALADALPLPVQAVLVVMLLALFGWVSWRYIVDAADRAAVTAMSQLWKKPRNAT